MRVLRMHKVMIETQNGSVRMGGVHENKATAQIKADEFNAGTERYRAHAVSCFVLEVPQSEGEEPLLFDLGLPVQIYRPREEKAEATTNQESQ